MNKYDIIIIGGGLGGLQCAAMLSKEGYKVCVLDKNARVGGCLQSFRRQGHILDTGIHYIGSMKEGQVLNQYFKYIGILGKLKLLRLDEEAFDVIRFGGEEYEFGMGHQRFAEKLIRHFPQERESIIGYTKRLKEVGGLISVENFRRGVISSRGLDYFALSASDEIDRLISDPVLRQVLAGSNLLYGGVRDSSTFYHHAMINNSNIEGACRFVGGSMQLADALKEVIEANGGVVFTNSEVTRIVVGGKAVEAVIVNGEKRLEATHFISDVHPERTFELLDKTPLIRQASISRFRSLKNSYGIFTVSLVMKQNTFPYLNRNYYLHEGDNVWHQSGSKTHHCLFCTQANTESDTYTDVVNLLQPMYIDELKEWVDTTVGHRGKEYELFKVKAADRLITLAEQHFPALKHNVEAIYTTTPLSYRDYTGTVDGSAYGILKNHKSLITTLIPARTKIGNLFLTGQNLNVHGVLGVTMTSMYTCAELLGAEYVAKRVGES